MRNEGDRSADGRRSAPLDSPDDDDLTDPFQLERAVWALLPGDEDIGDVACEATYGNINWSSIISTRPLGLSTRRTSVKTCSHRSRGMQRVRFEIRTRSKVSFPNGRRYVTLRGERQKKANANDNTRRHTSFHVSRKHPLPPLHARQKYRRGQIPSPLCLDFPKLLKRR